MFLFLGSPPEGNVYVLERASGSLYRFHLADGYRRDATRENTNPGIHVSPVVCHLWVTHTRACAIFENARRGTRHMAIEHVFRIVRRCSKQYFSLSENRVVPAKFVNTTMANLSAVMDGVAISHDYCHESELISRFLASIWANYQPYNNNSLRERILII